MKNEKDLLTDLQIFLVKYLQVDIFNYCLTNIVIGDLRRDDNVSASYRKYLFERKCHQSIRVDLHHAHN